MEGIAKLPTNRQNAASEGEEQRLGGVTTSSLSKKATAPRREVSRDESFAISSMFYGALDIGSNTVKATVFRLQDDGTLVTVAHRGFVTGLGTGLKDGLLKDDAMARTTDAIRELTQWAFAQWPHLCFTAAATSASREAQNASAFLEHAAHEAGLDAPPVIISGEQEATMTFQGAACAFPKGTLFINADPGGGSTEVTCGRAGEPFLLGKSLRTGCVRMRDQFCIGDRIAPDALAAAASETQALFQACRASWGDAFPQGCAFSVSGGTSFCAASLQAGKLYPPAAPMPEMTREQCVAQQARVCAIDLAERKRLPGLPPDRADVMPAGFLIILAFLDAFGGNRFLPNHCNLRNALAQGMLDGTFPVLKHT